MRVKIKTTKIKKFLKKLPRILGKHAFLTFLVLLFFGLIFGTSLFYKYNTLAQKIVPEITEKPLKFREKTYQEVLKVWEENEKKFEETDLKQYPDPFHGLTE